MGWKKDARAAIAADPDLDAVEWVIVFYNDIGQETDAVEHMSYTQAQGGLAAVAEGRGFRLADTPASNFTRAVAPGYWDRAEVMTQPDWDGQQ